LIYVLSSGRSTLVAEAIATLNEEHIQDLLGKILKKKEEIK